MPTSLARTRHADAGDLAALTDFYARCSPDALHRRFHVPTTRVSPAMVRTLLAPPRGWSLLAEQGDVVVGHACAGELSPGLLEVGLLVEDAGQRRGVGTRLLREVAAVARDRGYGTLVCLVQPDHEAVLRTVGRAGLTGATSCVDGLVEVVVPLPPGGASTLDRPA